MNEQLQSEMANWLASMREATGQGRDFILAEAPGFVRELVLVGRVESTVWLLVGIAFVVLAWRAARWVGRQSDDTDGALFCVGLLTAVLASIAALIVFLGCTNSFFHSWFAPKVYVAQQVVELLRGLPVGKP